MVRSTDWYSVYGLTADNAYESSKTQRQDCMMGTDLRKEKVYATLPKRRVLSINLTRKKLGTASHKDTWNLEFVKKENA